MPNLPYDERPEYIEKAKQAAKVYYEDELSIRDFIRHNELSRTDIERAFRLNFCKKRTLSEAGKIRRKKYPSPVMGNQARKNLSKRMSENNPGGRSKWFEIDGKKVQGTWEKKFALYCNQNDIKWERCKPWKYIMNGKNRNYTPDFYIPSKDLFVEIKGRWWGDDKEKMKCVMSQHQNKKIIILEKESLDKLLNNEYNW